MSQRNTMLTNGEAIVKTEQEGYELVGRYVGRKHKTTFKCPVHDQVFEALPRHVFSGMRLPCCNKEHMSALLSEKMKGEGNNFFGKKHSVETREKLSVMKQGAKNPLFGKPRPHHITESIRKAITGVRRSPETRAKLSVKAIARHKNFDYLMRKIRGGCTTGKQGIFYIVRVGDFLKFGSATTTMNYRLTRLRQKHGADASIEMHCFVDNAGDYEAEMMTKHREHWSHGEFFHDFRSELPCAN